MDKQQFIERYWRDATPADAIKEPPMVARFRDTSQEQWESGCLSGFDRPRSNSTERWWYSSNSAESFNFCQVYDAPDPGEGWRLIDPEKDKPQEGDEIYERETRTWRRRLTPFQSSALSINRRRIEPPKLKYEPFKWEDREQLRERWIGSNDGRWERFIAFIYNDSEYFYVNGISTESLLKEWHFLDTGEPVGRRVE